jgi:hypothetical protein
MMASSILTCRKAKLSEHARQCGALPTQSGLSRAGLSKAVRNLSHHKKAQERLSRADSDVSGM